MDAKYSEFFRILNAKLNPTGPKWIYNNGMNVQVPAVDENRFEALRREIGITDPRLKLYEAAIARVKFLNSVIVDHNKACDEQIRANRPNTHAPRIAQLENSISSLMNWHAVGGDNEAQIAVLKAELDQLKLLEDQFEKTNADAYAARDAATRPIRHEIEAIQTTLPRLFGNEGDDLLIPLGREPRNTFEAALAACV
ncbi:MAG: hypothetical protein IPK83_24235 [Planctomycetes bacterium]|nr:hypothetical protein [Planctomycetota bacterium]